jgi:hypothetical protein
MPDLYGRPTLAETLAKALTQDTGGSPIAKILSEQSPATQNPLMLAKALRQRAAYERPDPMANYPKDWNEFGQNMAEAFPIDSSEGVKRGAYNLAMSIGPQMIAYHGSPHKFDKFDMSKIGTGEGAQAYGHGLYFAESPNVAKSYVPKSGNPTWSGKEVKSYGMDGSVDFVDGSKGILRNSEWPSFRAAMENGPRTGNLYKVDLPDEQVAKMLDWDKPLSQQPKNIQDFFGTVDPNGRITTGLAYTRMLEKTGKTPQEISESLRAMGIPGIRYLDGGSRGTGAGTSNFVVFDDKIPKILGRE